MQLKKLLLIFLGTLFATAVSAKIAHCPDPANIKYLPQITRYVGKQDGINWMGTGASFKGKIIFKYALNDTTDGVDNNQVTCSYVDSADPYNRYFVISPADQQNAKVKWIPNEQLGSHWRSERATAIGSNANISSLICYAENPQDCPYTVENTFKSKAIIKPGIGKAQVIDLSNDAANN